MAFPREQLNPVEVFSDAREAINVTLGALLGAYIGLVASASKLEEGMYENLVWFLLGTIWLLSLLNAASDRFHREMFGLAGWYALGAPIGLVLALFAATQLPVDLKLIVVTFAVWIIALSFEAATAGVSFVIKRMFQK